ncbi:transaldolase [Croceivirga radicis]|uniref:Transaldolase n=1 Tax=Croceivirga radicis TaxID=1929488 RepID=A0A1V6LTN2_9FLAO|nr:transaldolase [Croceivirga radicis]OQD43346.1 transaldolase [Croceivirga radicis]
MNKILPLILFCISISCTDNKENKDIVYFAGEIVNPTSDFVVLYKDNKPIDSAALDAENRFQFKLENIDEGLHHFDHAPQYQYVYLEKGDSVLIRLNAAPAYFDESLVFSGDNEEVNNFLIEMFLTNEDEAALIREYYKLKPEAFSKKIDSLKKQKTDELKDLFNNVEISEEAKKIASASIIYNSYLHKERYPFYHKKYTGESSIHELGKDFYAYRKDLDLNNEELSYFRPYYDFLKHHFGNLSFMDCYKNCADNAIPENVSMLHINRHKLKMIDSVVSEKKLRNNLFRNIAVDYLIKEHEISKESEAFIADFKALSTNKEHIEEINDLYGNIKSLQINQDLPDLVLECATGKEKTLKSIAKNQKTVFYFWTSDRKRHFRNTINLINQLQKENPSYTFVGINLKTGNEEWLNMIAERNLNKENQYWAKDFKTVQKTLILDNLNKCIIANDTIIVNGFGTIQNAFATN